MSEAVALPDNFREGEYWRPLVYHAPSSAYSESRHRFNVVPAGRRSGKTLRAKRRLVRRAMMAHLTQPWGDPRFFLGAPTRDQARRLFWDDLKRMVPRSFMLHQPRETDLLIRLINGAEISVIGFDRPARFEGPPWDGGILDEYADMRPETWTQHIRPALMDRGGWCDFIGVPEGRNHYYDLFRSAQAEMVRHGRSSEWGVHTWRSEEVLPLYGKASEIEAAKRDMDPLTYEQELGGAFVTFEGRAYYQFDAAVHAPAKLPYDPEAVLVLCFDWNVSPGVAVVAQEMLLPGQFGPTGAPVMGTGVIGEVYIDNNSNTPAVCRRLVRDWAGHRGPVHCYGDSTGKNRGSAQTDGSDWELVRAHMLGTFGGRIAYRYPPGNPSERSRVNAVNSRLRSTDGTVRLMVDPSAAPHVVRDLEGVALLKGGSGEIDKGKHKTDGLTHLSDALGYYIAERFPVRSLAGRKTIALAGRLV